MGKTMSVHRQPRVRVHSMLTAVSSKPTERTTHGLTHLDNMMSGRTVHAVFYYSQNPFTSFDLDPVRVHLSEILSLYPPAMGRITRGDSGLWEVKCNDAGVRILRATVAVSLDEWLKTADGSEERDLMVWERMPEDPTIWSPFRIQVNEFEGGGAAIAVSCTHMLADATTVTHIVRSWAETNRGKRISFPPSFSPPPFESPVANGVGFESKNQATTPRNMATVTFKFSDSSIKNRLEGLQNRCFQTTPFDFLAGLFWQRVNHGGMLLNLGVDTRRRLKTPLPYGFFGNGMRFSTLSINANVKDNLPEVVHEISVHLANLGDDLWHQLATVVQSDGFTCVRVDDIIGDEQASMADLTFFNDRPGPVHVSYSFGDIDCERIAVIGPGSEGGFGRTVTVALPEDEVIRLVEDQEIQSLEPEIVLCGGRSKPK